MAVELWDIALLLLGAKIGGIIFSKLRQPSLVGELLAGIALGSVFGLVTNSISIQIVANLGIMFLILLTMMSIDFKKIDKELEKLVAAQVITAAIIFVALALIFKFMNMDLNLSMVMAVAVFGSSTGIAARTLMTMDSINSKEGQAIIGLQIVNGIIELLLISSVVNILQYHTLDVEPIIRLVLMIIGTVVVMSRIGTRFINWVFNYIQRFKMEEVLLAFTLLFAFVSAAVAEKAGVTSFLGIMLVGMLLSRTQQALTISQKIKELGESFFIPIFFASLGLTFSIAGLTENLGLLVIMLAAITAIRFIAYIIPLRILDCSFTESLKVGAGLLSMSEYGLLMLSIGLTFSVVSNTLYSVFLTVFLLINILSPLFIKLMFRIKPHYGKNWGKKGVWN
ncbi:MAG: cation:proton antiporter, partial [Candidatus Aenigmarchaeota archaeon]|nr:cation:proton antiporter [Candidatus Aenigmarchaeota archaeon]